MVNLFPIYIIGLDKYQAVNSIHDFIEEDGLTPKNRCIIAHNSAFDRKFVHCLWEKVGKEFPANLWIDTIPMMRQFIKDANLQNKKLKLADCLNIVGCKTVKGEHNAKSDTRNLYYLYNDLIKKYHYVDYMQNCPMIKEQEQEQEQDED